jgi:26S proteasome regulatory subunit N5
MVVAKAVAAKIDRPSGVVRFAARRAPAELLNGWARNIGRLLDIVEKSTQNIQKECMVHKVAIGAA